MRADREPGHDHHNHGREHEHEHAHGGFLSRFFHLHDQADGHAHGTIDHSVATSDEGIKALKWSFLALLLTAAVQVVVVWYSNSIALLADTIHNFADAGTAIPLWIAFTLARRPASPRFTYGLGRVEDLAGIVIVLVILSSALVALWEALDRFIHPASVANLLAVAGAGLVGFLGNEIAALIRIRAGKAINSAALIADGYHARADGLTSLAVVVGAAGVWIGFPLADPIVGIVITVTIFGIVWQSSKAVVSRMLDGIEPRILRELKHAVEHAAEIKDVSNVRARYVGHRLQGEVTVAVDPGLTIADADSLVSKIKAHAHDHLPELDRLVVVTTSASETPEKRQDPKAEGRRGGHSRAAISPRL